MKLKLPHLIREEKFGNSGKNIIKHLVCNEIEKDFEIISFQRGKAVVKDLEGIEYYIILQQIKMILMNINILYYQRVFLREI